MLLPSHSMEDMVSFKNNNVGSEQSPTPRCLSGSLRGSRNHNQRRNQQPQPQQRHVERNDSAATTIVQPPPPNSSIDAGYTVHHGCTLHTRLDQPVTSSMSGMDSKKVVQASTPTTVTVPIRNKNDGPASVSGVRRRSGPQGGGLRSPAAKRPPSAPVALQGWLHKQGSEGLMLWKKRWFVLSEYCLFYYKGPEEEKLLGSILLPSYRVTVCKPEDKVNKKFAFKAEHANMRTYHFAADNRESMNQWVNALTLATLLQDPSPGAGDAVVIDMAGQQDGERSGRPSVSSISSILNQSADDSDSGFHGFQSRDDPSHASNNNSSPNSVNTASFPNLSASNSNGNTANGNTGVKTNANVINNNMNETQPTVNGWIHQQSQYVQPGTSQQQQQPNQQYSHLIPSPQQHLHQHQSHLHQHILHQEAHSSSHNQLHQHKLMYQQQQQQSHTIVSNVQTVQPMPRKFGQPIYANAPPKPRRLTDGSTEYSTPSPDPDYRKSPVSPDVIALSKSPISDYDRNGGMIYGTRMNQPSQQSLRTDKSGLNYGYAQTQSTERRTPDTYGRSAKPRSSSSGGAGRPNGDYEEVYGAPQLYQRPAGPVGYTKGASPAPIPIPLYNQHHHQFQQPQQLQSPITSSNLVITRQPRAQPPPRPHSADFLEYEATRRPQQQIPAQCDESIGQQRRTPQRPKSSLDIVTPSDATNDGYFYSEERYAAQMRQSAVYLHQTPQHHQQQRNQSLSRSTMPAKLTGIRDRTDESRISTLPEAPCSAAGRTAQREHLHQQQQQQHVMPLQRHTEVNSSEAKLRRSLRDTSYEASSCRDPLTRLEEGGGAATVPRRIPDYEPVASVWTRQGVVAHQTCQAAHTVGRRWTEQQQFCRSASARLPRTRHPAALDADDDDDDDYGERSSEQDSRDGERRLQQREESMKRLLEWKQRMLQSPLTRKPSGSRSMGGTGSIAAGSRGRTQNELSSYYKQQALLDLAAHEASIAEARHSRRREDSHRPHVRSKSSDGRRTIANVSRYNSYSSDDEELGDVRRKRTRRPSHAGRSPRHLGTAEDRLSGAQLQDTFHPGNRTGQVDTATVSGDHHQPSSRPSTESKSSNVLSNLGSIPPDAGYEEVSFPSSQPGEFSPSPYPPATEKGSIRRIDREMKNLSGDSTSDGFKGQRKPSSILKSCSVYTVEQQQQQQARTEGRLEAAGGDSSLHGAKTVQWTGRREQDDWDSNIDEEKLIKEFSYQYIKPRKEESMESKKEEESPPGKTEMMNLVRCRIRSFEMSTDGSSPVKEVLSMQEPLKISPLQVTEAHVSRIDPSKKNSAVIRNFALGEANSQEAAKQRSAQGDHVKQASTDSNKSVKDILADFEQKSQQAHKQEYSRRTEVKHRGVFSDTETLLYNSASDVDQLEKFEKEKKRQRKVAREEEEDRVDQVVPEFFAGEETYGGTTKGKPDVPFRDKKKSVKPSTPEQTNLADEQGGKEGRLEDVADVTPEPNCARLSVTESLLTHGGQLSEESDTPSPSEKQDDINPEEHYLPMSPRKAILDPNCDDRPNPNMMESLFANLAHEESSYVEMALNGMNHSLLAPDEKGRKHDSGDYSTLDTPHYEFVCVSDSKMEPVYMEVSQLSEKEEKEAGKVSLKKRSVNDEASHTRTDLPDILTALKSDSSDADDESSKDLDSIDAPRHPRFSLSDTFRPASYYLGASRTMIAELHDSSDSELVSPPPIPTSPPPLDDLDSLDMQESLEIKKVSPQVAVTKDNNNGSNCDSPKSWNKPMGQVETHRPPSRFSDATISSTFRDSRISLESGASGSDSVIEPRNPEEEARRHRQLKRRPVSDEVCEVLDSLDELESLGSRFDRASIDLDQYLEELQARDAFNVDLYTKDLSYNGIYGFNENMLIVDKLQKTTCHDLSRQMNMMSQQFPYCGGSRNKIGSASSLPSMRVCDVPPSHQHSQSFTGDAHYENVTNFVPLRSDTDQVRRDSAHGVPQRNTARSNCIAHGRDSSYSMTSAIASMSTSVEYQRPSSAQSSVSRSHILGNVVTGALQTVSPPCQEQNRYQNHGRSASQDSAQYSLMSNHRASSSQDSGAHYPTVTESYLPGEQRSQSDQSGAPYYYSDLQASSMNGLDTEIPKPIGHTSRLPQLNNQRDDASALNKRNDIGRITNPIARQLPRQIQVEDIDEARRIAAELRKTTCQLLGDNKVDLVDKRNFYEADTLRRVKSTDPMPDVSLPQVSTRNLYPHGLRDKSNSQASNPESTYDGTPNAQASHRRSRSLEGLLDDVGLQNLMEQQRNLSIHRTVVESTRQEERDGQNAPSMSNNQVTHGGNFHAEDPWEQDSLWRESLRRVSLRNARSLDNLDDRTRSTDSRGRARITRGATYVNDSVALRREIRPEECTVDRPRVKRRPNTGRRQEREQDTTADCLRYEGLDRVSPEVYTWDEPRSEIYRKQRAEDTNRHFLEEGNLPPARLMSEAQMSTGTTGSSASFELDREKLRQWDLLSSACLLQEQQRGSMADSGRGLLPAPVAELPGDVLDPKNVIHRSNSVNAHTSAMSTSASTTMTVTMATTTTTTTTALAGTAMTSESCATTVPSNGGELSLKIINTQNHQDVPLTKELTKRQEVREQMDACNRATGEWLLKAGGVFRK